ncbi:hypothetical protein FA95DRAFT_1517697 [Auriscalpium vulgare]|uniref:Uncharacterized protein n=1 Tax=Auriscalpium vulgare TaxID=40419 RepID=A0ACB8RWU1_9AGAM|nr:hypothetical protein FA95DRAFT_1517697 [Auriscalpium vulgare]
MTQALRGFEADMLVMNADWEKKQVPEALEELRDNLMRLLDGATTANERARPLEERKLDYVHVEKGAEPRTPGTINKSISLLLARNRTRNDASNRAEFLHTRKRQRESSDKGSSAEDDASCARTDAKTIDRDVMMKFDVARNEEGPLRRTMKVEEKDSAHDVEGRVTAQRHPGLDERLKSIETHLAVKYVPSPPVSLLRRLQFIEEHIINLEREYPPWAALHFNQPRRGVRLNHSVTLPTCDHSSQWPPPPRPTPLIVPSHLTSSAPQQATPGTGEPSPASTSDATNKSSSENKSKGRAAKSSLHRAVLERLEVQRAINDLKGEGDPAS